MKNELISIIVPVYNVAKYLIDFINSLNNLSYPNFEVIFINDGSTDDSLKILNKACINKSNYKLITQPNSGVSFARNIGLKNAKGSYIYFCDPDDMLHPDILTVLERTIRENKADVSCCRLIRLEDDYKYDINNMKYKKKYRTEIFLGKDDLLVQFLSLKK